MASQTHKHSGDSYTRTGWDPTKNWPSEDHPMGVDRSDITSSGGLNWVGFLTLKMNTSSIWLYNFSQSGALTNKMLSAGTGAKAQDLTQQVDSFLSTVGKQPVLAPWNSDNSYAAIWTGANDLRDLTVLDRPEIHSRMAAEVTHQCERLYNAGVRNFLVNANEIIIATYLLPLIRHPETQLFRQRVQANLSFNKYLEQEISRFGRRYSDVNCRLVDTYEPFMAAFQNPAAYGAKDNSCYDKKQRCVRTCRSTRLWIIS
ncbi:hypothetical protein BGZ63DRAFT_394756 [Mariannaea sp. PMI_226]|nr:hypothetical protein BGZ63DRAFT_394756 [Mariannaea sp. PMI_226]